MAPIPDAVVCYDDRGDQHVILTSVVTEEDTVGNVFDRLRSAFDLGARAVWVVVPNIEQVYCYTSPTQVRILTRADELTGDALLPGFRLPLAELFPPTEPAAPITP